ncbi:hypothetical protein HDU81_004220 [Chytriomyces hyalinus]|nr:hypothetical protein HDU81_004220 [Chytriomyces hyalinus]
MRQAFQPDCFFHADKNSIRITNQSGNTIALHIDGATTSLSHGCVFQFPATDWTPIHINPLTQQSHYKYIPPSSHLIFTADSTLPLGVTVAPGTSSKLTIVNTTSARLRVSIHPTALAWHSVEPHQSIQLSSTSNSESRVPLSIQYFDGARVGHIVTAGQCVSVAPHSLPSSPFTPPPLPLKHLSVTSCNMRYGTANDLLNSWHYRREMLQQILHAKRPPTILCLQEALLFQRQEILAQFPWFQMIGVGRERDLGGEATPVLFDARVFMVRFSETFWLSETPEVPGSVTKSWGNNLARIATMVHLVPVTEIIKQQRVSQVPEVLVVNVHLDHEAPIAREKGILLVCKRIREYLERHGLKMCLVLLMGDFNCEEEGAPENKAVEREIGLLDVLALQPKNGGQGTFHDFGGNAKVPRIDYIYASPEWKSKVADSGVVKDCIGGQEEGSWWPSDHFPVVAEFSLNTLDYSRKISLKRFYQTRPFKTGFPAAIILVLIVLTILLLSPS